MLIIIVEAYSECFPFRCLLHGRRQVKNDGNIFVRS